MSSLNILLFLFSVTLTVCYATDNVIFRKKRSGCDQTYYGPNGNIESPAEKNGFYANNLWCTLTIKNEGGPKDIVLDLKKFDLEPQRSCYWDSLTVPSGHGIYPNKLCGQRSGQQKTLRNVYGDVKLTFKTDSSVTYPGFLIKYTVVDSEKDGGYLTTQEPGMAPGWNFVTHTYYDNVTDFNNNNGSYLTTQEPGMAPGWNFVTHNYYDTVTASISNSSYNNGSYLTTQEPGMAPGWNFVTHNYYDTVTASISNSSYNNGSYLTTQEPGMAPGWNFVTHNYYDTVTASNSNSSYNNGSYLTTQEPGMAPGWNFVTNNYYDTVTDSDSTSYNFTTSA
ncbi:uncharacterized protein LOC126826569 [Patella vulgata]|uniref:uncharacterized protein LOC126826569 n=1 Tax=Patella vulgata TaxID=6465 RepID=UPI0021807D6B|nr:uncharacterized protein LOC126826569 [Patella vulgata]